MDTLTSSQSASMVPAASPALLFRGTSPACLAQTRHSSGRKYVGIMRMRDAELRRAKVGLPYRYLLAGQTKRRLLSLNTSNFESMTHVPNFGIAKSIDCALILGLELPYTCKNFGLFEVQWGPPHTERNWTAQVPSMIHDYYREGYCGYTNMQGRST